MLRQNDLTFSQFSQRPKEHVVESFKNIATVGVHCWNIKILFSSFVKKLYFRRYFSGWLLSIEFKFNLKKFISAVVLLKCKSFIQYRTEIRLGNLTSPVSRQAFFHVS